MWACPSILLDVNAIDTEMKVLMAVDYSIA